MTQDLLTLIERSANIYFWLFIVFFIITILYQQTDQYEETKRNKIRNGTYYLGMTSKTMLLWFLFILSCYYK